ncbi:MAG: DUF2953 domain-containing protein [ANME-2 cluster archaeon]|nr:MAG: DUF2953 domain-containing protein [ANME-2 cluster archaeon]
MTWLLIPGILIALILVVLGILMFPVMINVESNRSRGTIDGKVSVQWVIIKIRHSLKDKRTEILLFSHRMISLQHKEEPISTINSARQQDIDKPKETTKAIDTAKPKDTKEPKKSKKTRKIRPITFLNVIKPLLRFSRGLFATISFRHLSIDTTYGMEDPGLTGMLTGYLHAVKGSTQLGQNLQFTPDFTRSILDWDMSASASITPIRIFPPIARFVINRQVLRSGWEILRG